MRGGAHGCSGRKTARRIAGSRRRPSGPRNPRLRPRIDRAGIGAPRIPCDVCKHAPDYRHGDGFVSAHLHGLVHRPRNVVRGRRLRNLLGLLAEPRRATARCGPPRGLVRGQDSSGRGCRGTGLLRHWAILIFLAFIPTLRLPLIYPLIFILIVLALVFAAAGAGAITGIVVLAFAAVGAYLFISVAFVSVGGQQLP